MEQDFLEVPSMALEKFACHELLLERVAHHWSGEGKELEKLGSLLSPCFFFQMCVFWSVS